MTCCFRFLSNMSGSSDRGLELCRGIPGTCRANLTSPRLVDRQLSVPVFSLLVHWSAKCSRMPPPLTGTASGSGTATRRRRTSRSSRRVLLRLRWPTRTLEARDSGEQLSAGKERGLVRYEVARFPAFGDLMPQVPAAYTLFGPLPRCHSIASSFPMPPAPTLAPVSSAEDRTASRPCVVILGPLPPDREEMPSAARLPGAQPIA